jgi:hypothetical protein
MSGSRPVPERGYNSASSDVISLRNRLEELIEDFATERETFDPSTVHGRIYTASSIDYDSDSSLVQTASSPSYWGGLWSLTCCKHDMRQEHFFNRYFKEINPGVLRPVEPLLIFTCAGKTDSNRPDWSEQRRRWLTSVALVTHAFQGMDDYGRFLLQQGEEVWKNRISTQGSSEHEWARKYGDCHAITSGGNIAGVGTPYPEHDHVSGSGTTSCGCSSTVDPEYDHVYHEDNDRSLLKFVSVSEYWMSWSEPQFYWTRTNGRSRFGGGRHKRAFHRQRESPEGTVLSELRGTI